MEEINAICIESGLEVFRRSFPACEAAATSAAAAVPIAEALKAWLQHCRAHLEQAASAALTVLRAAIEEKQEQLPMKSGLLEAWTASQTNTAMQAIDPIALALGVSAPQRSEGGGLETSEETPPHSASNLLQNCRSDLSVRCEVELRVIRTRNSELLRKESPPEAAHFGKLIASDGAVTCVVIVPQPSANSANRWVFLLHFRRDGMSLSLFVAILSLHPRFMFFRWRLFKSTVAPPRRLKVKATMTRNTVRR